MGQQNALSTLEKVPSDRADRGWLAARGGPEAAFPPFLDAATCIDFRQRDVYFSAIFDVILKLHGIPFEMERSLS